ncbi:MAG: hypothetical protein A2Y17_05285 [Clostridiales bacterium GWF2_38_85]|nr:MAG: hypothetical protein A2Y17_05285 [Clostridiales bacterium GWF2_38_85]HBL83357.1 hypothetical protein [Clostridiales bacterium]
MSAITKITSQMIKARAKELGIDDVGIASIDAFDGAPILMAPKSYFPEAKSVIVIVMRIPRGSYRGIEEGTHWHNYTYYSYNKLNTIFRPRLTYQLSTFIEDHGWEACPCFPAVPERNGIKEPVAEGKLSPDIVINIRVMAAGSGVGEIGHSKVFLSRKYGPRVRLGLILTDAELEPDEIYSTGTICNGCGRCAKECPGNAIPAFKDQDKKLHVTVGGKDIYWGDVQMGRCTLTHHGFNNKISPFHKKAFPNMKFDVDNSVMTEEEAYRLCYPMATAKWMTYDDAVTDNIIEYYGYIMKQVGYFAVCGARGCIRACMDSLEKSKRIENLFHNKFYRKPSWMMTNEPEEVEEGVNQFRDRYLDNKYPGVRENEYKYKYKGKHS